MFRQVTVSSNANVERGRETTQNTRYHRDNKRILNPRLTCMLLTMAVARRNSRAPLQLILSVAVK
jgi:hypothetical protein